MIAEQLFDKPIAVLRLPPDTFKSLSNAQYASSSENTLGFDSHSIARSPLSVEAMSLTDSDPDMLQGSEGVALKVAMEILWLMAAAQGADT
jgi:hypothetical protein